MLVRPLVAQWRFSGLLVAVADGGRRPTDASHHLMGERNVQTQMTVNESCLHNIHRRPRRPTILH